MAAFWLKSLLLIGLSGFAAGAILSHQTPDLGHVLVGPDATDHAPIDVVEMLGQAVVKQSAQVEISEGDLNDYLARRLTSMQGGHSARVAHFDRLLCDLEDGHCIAYLCWNVFGHLDVVTVQFNVQRKGNQFVVEIEKGAYGRLQVSRGFLTPMIPALEEVVRACKPEIDAIFRLPHLRITKNKLVMDAKF